MKLYLAAIWGALLLCLPSCAIHPCGKPKEKPQRSDFSCTEFKRPHHVYPITMTRGAGAPIMITHGLGGLDGATLEWAKALGERGWKVYLPQLDSDFDMCKLLDHSRRMAKSGIWETKALNSSGRVLEDMGHLVDWISRKHGNGRVVVVGNCLTGGFPLALLARRSVKTAVLCQPAIPVKSLPETLLGLPQSPEKRRAFGISAAQLEASLRALERDPSKRLLGFHYLEDPIAPMDKFQRLHDELSCRGLGKRFEAVVLVPPKTALAWWEPMETEANKGLTKPHVTLTGSPEPDRTRLRRRFDQLVRP